MSHSLTPDFKKAPRLHSLTRLTLFSLLAFAFHPLPLWPGPFPLEPAFSRLPEKPVEIRLLDPNKVQSAFVIQNPTLEDGRKLRMHSSGNLIEIQNSDGTWSGPFYLPTEIKVPREFLPGEINSERRSRGERRSV